MKNFFTHNMRKKSPLQIIGIIVFGAIAITALAILFGFIIMWLWNWLMPDIFGLTTLTYWQSVGLFILFKLFFGGCGKSGYKKESKNASCEDKPKKDFSKWRDYDKFWKEEGDEFYNQYLERKSSRNED